MHAIADLTGCIDATSEAQRSGFVRLRAITRRGSTSGPPCHRPNEFHEPIPRITVGVPKIKSLRTRFWRRVSVCYGAVGGVNARANVGPNFMGKPIDLSRKHTVGTHRTTSRTTSAPHHFPIPACQDVWTRHGGDFRDQVLPMHFRFSSQMRYESASAVIQEG